MVTETHGVARPASHASEELLVDVQDLQIHFPVMAGFLIQRKVAENKAVDGITFNVKKGETVGLVGESMARTCRPCAVKTCASCAAGCRWFSRTPTHH